MTTINPNKAGLAFGAVIGLWHLCWSLLVAIGWAQTLIDFVFRIHFMKPVFVVGGFSFLFALILIALTSVVGYVFGYVFAFLWNWLHRKSGRSMAVRPERRRDSVRDRKARVAH
jgi:hypothetical protein